MIRKRKKELERERWGLKEIEGESESGEERVEKES